MVHDFLIRLIPVGREFGFASDLRANRTENQKRDRSCRQAQSRDNCNNCFAPMTYVEQ
jgi:hypothetical protein